MQHFLSKHCNKISGTLSSFDRVLFKGHLPTAWGKSMRGVHVLTWPPYKRVQNLRGKTFRQACRACQGNRGKRKPDIH